MRDAPVTRFRAVGWTEARKGHMKQRPEHEFTQHARRMNLGNICAWQNLGGTRGDTPCQDGRAKKRKAASSGQQQALSNLSLPGVQAARPLSCGQSESMHATYLRHLINIHMQAGRIIVSRATDQAMRSGRGQSPSAVHSR